MAKATSSGGNYGDALSPGSRVGGGRYLLKRLVGRGEFSELWLARDVPVGRDVALKFLPRAFLQDTNLLEHFQEEVRRNQLLKHPHIIPTYELVRDYDTAAIAMEFVDGWSLATLKVDKLTHCYSVEEIKPWIAELCGALAYAHNEFGMVHGDLKPSNLLVSAREGIKVSDFGFAVLIRNESSRRGIIKSGYGGIGFLSPQQVMGAAPSKLDDIYSLGASIFDLITGTPPFYKGEIIAQICSLEPPRMTERLKELFVQCDPIPPVWEETIAACLAKNPAERPQSAEEVMRLLERTETRASSDLVPQIDEEPDAAEPPETHESPEPTGEKEPSANVTPVTELLPASQPGPQPKTMMFAGILAVLVIIGLAAAFWLTAGLASHSPGSLDKNFNAGTGTDNSIRSMVLLPDGKILAGGFFTYYNGVVTKRIVRLNPDGTLDSAFAAQLPGAVYSIVLQSDGKVIAGGESLQAGKPRRKVIRLNPDGSLDESFGEGANYNRDVRVLAVQPDGKVLVGGSFNRVFNKPLSGLVRLNADGSLDDSFDAGKGASATVWALAVQPDGKILAGGELRFFNGDSAGHIVRLNPDGSRDDSFNIGNGADAVVSGILLQKDGKILICGNFDHVNESTCHHIARLNPDGSLDTSFQPADGLGDGLRCMAVGNDGKIIVGGSNTVNGQARPFLARLNANGSLDQKFQVTEATGGSVWSADIQADGKILVAGYFSSFDTVLCGNVVRLQN